MVDPIKARFDIAFENPGRAVVLTQDLVTLIQCIRTAAATAKAVGVGEQINQCMDFTPSALLSCLHDTRLEPTDIVPDLAPVDGVPVRNRAGSRTSKRCRRRHICFAPRVSWPILSRDERPEGSLPAFAVG